LPQLQALEVKGVFMHCSGCGKDIPFAGDVCPYCHRDKSQDQQYTVLAFILGLVLGYIGYLVFDWWGVIGGFIAGCAIAVAMSGAGETEAPEVKIANNNAQDIDVSGSIESRLSKLNGLKESGLITDEDYNKCSGIVNLAT